MTLPGTVEPPPPLALAGLPAGGGGTSYASWRRRVAGDLLDGAILTGVGWLALGDAASHTALPLGMPSAFDADASWHRSGWVAAALLAVLALQAWTGWTPGKLVVGIAVVSDRDGRPIGLLRTLLRWAVHVLDTILFVGYLRPLWHRERRTFADSVMRTVVVRRRPAGLGRGGRLLTGGALVLCLLGAGLTVPWTTPGSPDARAEATCFPSPAAPDDVVGAVEPVRLTGLEARIEERRLWSRRVVDVYRSYSATWTWTTASAGGDLAIELTATGPDGQSRTQRSGVSGHSTEVDQVGVTTTATGELSATTDLGTTWPTDLGPVVDLTTSLLVDRQVVATCTVEGFALTSRRA
ncbi:RDD family protein [Xylanimonas protaetiae]|uniref:RDD family protein n=1 Tax=Xylanimonas protaetiae TaxID=2509457 RepID=A0A4P6FAH7_9MICO|nr:RDD family protein [Xylanimonas protaetiae]QAY71289.1 RDD family protein [Xylanimonas protaetiae]